MADNVLIQAATVVLIISGLVQRSRLFLISLGCIAFAVWIAL